MKTTFRTLVAVCLVLSASAVAQAPITDADLAPGVITLAECHGDTGNGAVVLQRVKGKALTSVWYKVRAFKLCGGEIQHPAFIGKTSRLSALAADNISGASPVMSIPIFDQEGFLVDIKNAGPEPQYAFQTHQVYGQETAMTWLFAQRQ